VISARLKRLRGLKAEFDAAHRQGMNALKAGDYSALEAAILAERAIIDEQAALLKEAHAEITERGPHDGRRLTPNGVLLRVERLPTSGAQQSPAR
jgi:hypothetical protein